MDEMIWQRPLLLETATAEEGIVWEAIAATPTSNPYRAIRSGNLGIRLSNTYDKTGALEDLEEAIHNLQEAVKITPPDHINRAIWLGSLGRALGNRYDKTGELEDFKEAIHNLQEAVKLTPDDHSNRAVWLGNLGCTLGNRYDKAGELEDLEEAIHNLQEAVKITPHDHPNRAIWLGNLGRTLGNRYDKTRALQDLKEAIHNLQEAVKITPHDHPNRAICLGSLGSKLKNKYFCTWALEDLEGAIHNLQEAVKITPHDHPNRAIWLGNLGRTLGNRYHETLALEDLEEAIHNLQEAVKITPHDHPNRAICLGNLGRTLGDRYDKTGALEDLEEAIRSLRETVEITPHDHPNRALWLTNLGSKLTNRYSCTRALEDLEGAIHNLQEAVKTTPHDHFNPAIWLRNLHTLGDRYDTAGALQDLKEAVRNLLETVEITPHDHPNRALWLINLCRMLTNRFKRPWALEEIQNFQEAVEMTPDDHSNHLKARPSHHPNEASCSQILNLTEKGGDSLRGTARKGSSIDEVTDFADVFRPKDLIESSGLIKHSTSAATSKLFHEAVKRETHQIFFVSTLWLMSLKDHENLALVPILREAGYEMTSQTSTTTWYENILRQVRYPTGGQCDDASSSPSREIDVAYGNVENYKTSGQSKRKMDDKDDAGYSSGVANTLRTKRNQGGSQSTCKPQRLRMVCLCSLPTLERLFPNEEHNKRREFCSLNVTMPEKGQFKTISTIVEKNFSIEGNKFSSDGRRREVSEIHLKAMATTSLTCCCKIDDHSWKVRIKFATITGQVKNEGSDKELCNAMVISSFCTSVHACIKRSNGENHPGEPINLGVGLDLGPRIVSATAQQLEGNSEQIPQVPVWCEKSGRTPRRQAPTSTTLALLTDIEKRREEDFRRRSQEVHPLHFQDPKNPIVFEGDIESGDIHPDSFFKFHIGYLLEVSYYKPCSGFGEGPTWPANNCTQVIDFDCCFEIRTNDLLLNQSM